MAPDIGPSPGAQPWPFYDLPNAYQQLAGQMILASAFLTATLDVEFIAGSIFLIEGDPLHLLPEGFKVDRVARATMLRESVLACAASESDCDPRPGKAIAQIPKAMKTYFELMAGPDATAYGANPEEAYLQLIVKWAAMLSVSDDLFVMTLRDWPARSAFERIQRSWPEVSVRGAERVGSDAFEQSAREQSSFLSAHEIASVRTAVSRTLEPAHPAV